MSKIQEHNFSDLYEMGSGVSSKPEQAGHGSPFASFGTVFNNFFLPDDLEDLMDTSKQEQETYSLKAGDILLTRTSETIDELGMSCVVLKDYPGATFSGFVKRLRPTQDDITYPRYMGFYLRSKFFRKTMTNNAVLTLRASLNEDIFSYLKLYLPDYQTQKIIGDFLYKLHSKISLNNRINAQLEAVAKTIYDYWFVQFDFPISKEQAKSIGKPKLEGKPYKASGGTMIWNEELKREIPQTWNAGSLLEIATYTNGLACQKFRPVTDDKLRVIKIREMNEGFSSNTEFVRSDIPQKAIIQNGDLLFSWSASLDVKIWTGGLGALNQHIFKVSSDKYPTSYCYFQLLNYLSHFKMMAENRKTTMGHITQEHLEQSRIPIAPSKLILQLDKILDPLIKEKISNEIENQKLSELRDWLLPMLMNGQVKIKQIAQANVLKAAASQHTPTNQYIYQTQLVGTIVNASKKYKISHGEMTLAKYSYLLDKIYKIPTYFKYDRWHLGPYPPAMKKVFLNKKFFTLTKNGISVVPQKAAYTFEPQQEVERAVADLASIFSQYQGSERSHQTELLATVCKVVEDIKSTDLKAVRESMKKWSINLKGEKFKNKADKFSEAETKNTLDLIIKRKWDGLLVN